MKRIGIVAINILFLILLIEIAFYSFFKMQASKILFSNPEMYVLSMDEIKQLGAMYSAELGWDNHFQTQYGERQSQTEYDKKLLASYGDSFTYGSDVSENCTWQEFIEQDVHQDVFNFGVGAYGLDQALLKFKLNVTQKKIKTQFVSLGFIIGDINRNMNIYRKFLYTFEGGMPYTKPRFDINSTGEVYLRTNPIQKITDLDKLTDAKFIRQIFQLDWWHSHFQFPDFSFPYSLHFYNSNIFNQMQYKLDLAPWFDINSLKIFDSILLEFKLTALQIKAQPIFIVFPDRLLIDGLKKNPEKYFQITKTIESSCEQLKLKCLLVYQDMMQLDESSLEKLWVDKTYSSHYSCEGNQYMAKKISDFIKTIDSKN